MYKYTRVACGKNRLAQHSSAFLASSILWNRFLGAENEGLIYTLHLGKVYGLGSGCAVMGMGISNSVGGLP